MKGEGNCDETLGGLVVLGATLVGTGFIASGVHVVVGIFDGSVGVQVCSHGIVVGHGGLSVVVIVH